MLQFFTKFYNFLQNFTIFYKILQFFTKFYNFLQNFTIFYKILQFFTKFYNFLQNFTIFYKILQFFTKFYNFVCATIIQLSLLYCRVCGLCIQQHSSVKIGGSITMTVFVSVLTRAVESPLHCLLAVIPTRSLVRCPLIHWV